MLGGAIASAAGKMAGRAAGRTKTKVRRGSGRLTAARGGMAGAIRQVAGNMKTAGMSKQAAGEAKPKPTGGRGFSGIAKRVAGRAKPLQRRIRPNDKKIGMSLDGARRGAAAAKKGRELSAKKDKYRTQAANKAGFKPVSVKDKTTRKSDETKALKSRAVAGAQKRRAARKNSAVSAKEKRGIGRAVAAINASKKSKPKKRAVSAKEKRGIGRAVAAINASKKSKPKKRVASAAIKRRQNKVTYS